MRQTTLIKIIAPLFPVARLLAQEASSCSARPGAAFGITGYQCANCSFTYSQGQRPSFSFMSEPVVLDVVAGSNVLVGDVIEAVNGNPITTRTGSDQFSYPPRRENTLTVRRGREHQTIRISAVDMLATLGAKETIGCGTLGSGAGKSVSGTVSAGPGNGAVGGVGSVGGSGADGRGTPLRTIHIQYLRGDTVPLIIIDGAVVSGNPPFGMLGAARVGRYGFAVSCEPSCIAATDSDGPINYTYYKYPEPPEIAAVRVGSPAERAGLKIKDVLLKIDGHPITDDTGALLLARIDKREAVRLTVRRDGKELDYVLTIK